MNRYPRGLVDADEPIILVDNPNRRTSNRGFVPVQGMRDDVPVADDGLNGRLRFSVDCHGAFGDGLNLPPTGVS